MSATPGKQELAAVKSRASQFTIPSHNHNPQFQSQLTIQFQIIDLPFTSQFIISIIQDSQLGLQFTIQINTILIHNPNSQHFRCTNKCNKNIQNPDAFLFFFISIAARSLINQILKPIKPVLWRTLHHPSPPFMPAALLSGKPGMKGCTEASSSDRIWKF